MEDFKLSELKLRKTILELRKSGMTYSDISNNLKENMDKDLSRQYICKLCNNASNLGRDFDKEIEEYADDKREIEEMFDEGYSQMDIYREMNKKNSGWTYNKIRRALIKMGKITVKEKEQ